MIGNQLRADHFWDQLMLLVRRMRREALVGPEPWARLSLLAAIDRLGNDASPTALAKDLELRSSNVAAALREVEERGYLVRTSDASDRRSVRLELTPIGYKLLEEARLQRSRWMMQTIAEEFTQAEQLTLFAAGDLIERLAKMPGASR